MTLYYDYRVLLADTLPAIVEYVNDAIAMGYQPIGGVAVALVDPDNEGGYRFYQAVARVGE